jgi:Ca-activated chloride channel family protein
MHVSSRVVCALTLALSAPLMAEVNAQDSQPTFRAGVDLVSIAAVVRDKQGRVVQSLTKDDFTVLDGGQSRPIVDFQADANGPISVGLLIDGSGSMRQNAALSHRVGELLLMLLNAKSDEVALMSFDTRLLNRRRFTSDFAQVRMALGEVDTFGASSIYDAIAGAAGVVDEQTKKRRAVLVVTDGSDNWSTYTPAEVAWVASTIDIPVYVLAVTPAAPGATDAQSVGGELGEIARATGGEYFAADNETRQAMALGRIIDDLRHQYLLAFEPSSKGGLRSLEVRTRKPTHKIRARQWYSAKGED